MISTHSTKDLRKAFERDKGGGYRCESIAELITYVTELLRRIGEPKDNLHDLLELSEGHGSESIFHGRTAWWFRGVESGEFRLNSGVFRHKLHKLKYPNPAKNRSTLDRRLQHEFALFTRRRRGEVHGNVWDRLSQMQHYGMPTRLLDWTIDFLSAVYFALKEPEKKKGSRKENPVIWILNPRLLSGVFLGESALNDFAYLESCGHPDEMKDWRIYNSEHEAIPAMNRDESIYEYLNRGDGHYPVFLSWTNPRVHSQSGYFTVQCGNKPGPLDAPKGRPPEKSDVFLLKVRVKRDCIDDARAELANLGYDDFKFSPETENVVNSIRTSRGIGT